MLSRALFRWIHAILRTTIHEILISHVKRQNPGNGVVHCATTNTGPDYANHVVTSRMLI